MLDLTVDWVKSQASVVPLVVPYSLKEEYIRVRMESLTFEWNAYPRIPPTSIVTKMPNMTMKYCPITQNYDDDLQH